MNGTPVQVITNHIDGDGAKRKKAPFVSLFSVGNLHLGTTVWTEEGSLADFFTTGRTLSAFNSLQVVDNHISLVEVDISDLDVQDLGDATPGEEQYPDKDFVPEIGGCVYEFSNIVRGKMCFEVIISRHLEYIVAYDNMRVKYRRNNGREIIN